MKIVRKIKSLFHDDWCKKCTNEMSIIKKQLYMLPMYVGHYTSHQDASFYKKNLVRVEKKADIPTGQYACGITKYRCSDCQFERVKLSIFLPVRDIEKFEEVIFYENGEMDDFLNNY